MEYFSSFLDSTIIFSIVSFLVGAFIALRTYQVTKQKKDFEQKNQLRDLLKEFLIFEGKYTSSVAEASLALSKATSINDIRYIDHTPKLLNLITKHDLRDHSDKPVNKAVATIYKIHRKNILLRNLYLYSLEDSIEKHPKALSDYEKQLFIAR